MSTWCKFLLFAMTVMFCVACKKGPAQKNPFEAEKCKADGMEGVQNIDKECKKCCEKAGYGHAFSPAAGCNCL